jgi:hypothetical protein
MIRDSIIVEDARGNRREFGVEGLFEVDDQSYVLISSAEDEPMLLRVEGEGDDQELVGIQDPELLQSLLDAYQIAVEAAPAEGEE